MPNCGAPHQSAPPKPASEAISMGHSRRGAKNIPATSAKYQLLLAPGSMYSLTKSLLVKNIQLLLGSKIALFACNIPFHPPSLLFTPFENQVSHSSLQKTGSRYQGDIGVIGIICILIGSSVECE